MSKPNVSLVTVCILLVLVLFVVIPGCTMIPGGSEGTIPVTSFTPVTTPLSTPPSQYGQPAGDIQLEGNVYGLSSDPMLGIDTITFSIGLPAHASPVDLTRMEIIFSTPGNAPVSITPGTRETTTLFTTTTGGNRVTALHPGEEVDISFRIKPVTGGTSVNIEVRPPDGAALSMPRKVPAMISSLNVL